MRLRLTIIGLLLGSMFHVQAQADYFYPQAGPFNSEIPTPEEFLGYPIGSHHTRQDQIVSYLQKLAILSNRVSYEIIGETFEHRSQIIAIFTASSNHQQLETIRKKHLDGQITGNTSNLPLVVHLGYNVHGNEPSSSEAALLTAWYLTASENPETKNWLENMIILMDPVINPDGRDRHTHWANMHKGTPPVADPLDREHTEIWPGGRFNHYWFDLNRDWFLGTFPETRNRIAFFHKWRPYVQTDHHEMGTNSTFYFDPGEDASNNPIVPDYLYKKIYPAYAEAFAKATDKLGSLYFTKEAYDKLYPGYGSSYINFYGGAGFLFEQASSRGHIQETKTIPITFAFTIRNQFTASLTTLRASLNQKEMLLTMRRSFYKTAKEQQAAAPVKGYVFGDPNDKTRTEAFLSMLLMHEIDVYINDKQMTASGQSFEGGKTYYVPTAQDNYIMVRSVFENDITYIDSSFYDASTWSLIQAYGLPFAALKSEISFGKKLTSVPQMQAKIPEKSAYAYALDNRDYHIFKAIYHLQKSGVIVQTAFRPFTVMEDKKEKTFGRGSLIIPVQQQFLTADSLYQVIRQVAQQTMMDITPLQTGLSTAGIDLGSRFVQTLTPPKVLMIIGTGVSATEAGEIWHLLDQRLQMPITKMDILNLRQADLKRYNTIIMVSGNYSLLDKTITQNIKNWVQAGNTLIALKSGAEWALKNGFTKEKIPVEDSSKKKELRRSDFDEAANIEGAKSLGGSIFQVDLDTTHPIGFGFSNRLQPVYKNGTTLMLPSENPYATVAQYTKNPLIGGYVHPTTLKKIKNAASIIVSKEGNGRVILFADNPNFRGTWYGTNRLFLNALFYCQNLDVPSVRTEETE